MEKQVVFKAKLLPYLLVAPQMIIVFGFFFWPASQAMYQSVFIQDAFGLSSRFVGLGNFIALFKDEIYLDSLATTMVFAFLVAFGSLAVALFLAVLANKVIRGGMVYKTLIILPYAVAAAVAGVLWLFLFNPTVGVVTYALKTLGYKFVYTLNGGQAFALVVVASCSKQISYNFLFFLAGLENVPESLLEAASIDGANPTRRFWTIVFPILMPTTFFLIVMNSVYAFFVTFSVIHQVTAGGPNRATNILVYKVFHDGFLGMDLGSSSAQSVILMIIVVSLTVLQFRFIEKKVQY